MIRLAALLMLSWLLAGCGGDGGTLRLVVLDVGEGQAVLLQRGTHGVLVDAGHPGMGARILARLRSYGVRTLDALYLTHLHPDHAGGYFRLREAFPSMVVRESGHRPDWRALPDTSRWIVEALERDPRHQIVAAGHHWRWRGVDLAVLWPKAPSGADLNAMSLVLQVGYGGAVVLIMGDAGTAAEAALLRAGRPPGPVAVLVVGHHGAADASGERFLETVRPRMAVVSVNAGNRRGYPAPAVLRRLERWAGQVWRTDRDGDVCLVLRRDGSGEPC